MLCPSANSVSRSCTKLSQCSLVITNDPIWELLNFRTNITTCPLVGIDTSIESTKGGAVMLLMSSAPGVEVLPSSYPPHLAALPLPKGHDGGLFP